MAEHNGTSSVQDTTSTYGITYTEVADDLALAKSLTWDALMENQQFLMMAHKAACYNLELDPDKTYIGGDEHDAIENAQKGLLTITENDPRHDLYWCFNSQWWQQLFGLMIATNPGWRKNPHSYGKPAKGFGVVTFERD